MGATLVVAPFVAQSSRRQEGDRKGRPYRSC